MFDNRGCVITDEELEDIFEYHPWDEDQISCGADVKKALAEAFRVVVISVPPCPTRTRALNAITDARMLANAAITHRGKY
jgi:hypothetical protein